ncbi:MAG: 50S ribosomal protein L35 [Chloroflexi bacterium]|nr:50S ribosomal protein L35 [Chloroflexota bacterium]
MPKPRLKLKTHKAAQARFHITGTGKLVRLKGHRSHLRRKKSQKNKRLFNQKLVLDPSFAKKIRPLLPYGVP